MLSLDRLLDHVRLSVELAEIDNDRSHAEIG